MTDTATIWWIYFVRMPDQRLYCGISTDVERRFAQHQKGTGAKALRGKSPLLLVWAQPVGNRSEASQLEYALKQQSKVAKEHIVNMQLSVSQIVKDLHIQN